MKIYSYCQNTYKGGEVRCNTIWGEIGASSVCHKTLSGRYDCTYGMPLFHDEIVFHLT